MAAAQPAEKPEMPEIWPDTYNVGYIHQFLLESTHKIHYQQQNHWV